MRDCWLQNSYSYILETANRSSVAGLLFVLCQSDGSPLRDVTADALT